VGTASARARKSLPPSTRLKPPLLVVKDASLRRKNLGVSLLFRLGAADAPGLPPRAASILGHSRDYNPCHGGLPRDLGGVFLKQVHQYRKQEGRHHHSDRRSFPGQPGNCPPRGEIAERDQPAFR